MYFSKATGGFYDPSINAEIPEDAVEITSEEHTALLQAQSTGKMIEFDTKTKKPVAKDYVPTPADLAAQAKSAKETELASIIVTTQSGKSFDGNERARNNMMSAIMASEIVGQTSAAWKLADNTVATVTLAEIKEALALAIQRVGEIITAGDAP